MPNMVSSQGDERREDHQHDANHTNHGDTQEETTMTTDHTNYSGVFEDVVKPSDATYQPGLINRWGRTNGDDAGTMRWL